VSKWVFCEFSAALHTRDEPISETGSPQRRKGTATRAKILTLTKHGSTSAFCFVGLCLCG
jgi:hypothetical protein